MFKARNKTNKHIDTINVAAGDTGGTTIYYDGEGPSGSFRQKVIGWAQILHGMNIPKCICLSMNRPILASHLRLL